MSSGSDSDEGPRHPCRCFRCCLRLVGMSVMLGIFARSPERLIDLRCLLNGLRENISAGNCFQKTCQVCCFPKRIHPSTLKCLQPTLPSLIVPGNTREAWTSFHAITDNELCGICEFSGIKKMISRRLGLLTFEASWKQGFIAVIFIFPPANSSGSEPVDMEKNDMETHGNHERIQVCSCD